MFNTHVQWKEPQGKNGQKYNKGPNVSIKCEKDHTYLAPLVKHAVFEALHVFEFADVGRHGEDVTLANDGGYLLPGVLEQLLVHVCKNDAEALASKLETSSAPNATGGARDDCNTSGVENGVHGLVDGTAQLRVWLEVERRKRGTDGRRIPAVARDRRRR